MTLTWRQLVAYLKFSDKLDSVDRVNELMITAVGSQGDHKAIEKAVKELM